MSQHKQFTLYQEPHIAEVGEHAFKFRPEIYADEALDAWVEFRNALDAIQESETERDDDTDDDGAIRRRSPEEVKERAETIAGANRRFIASYLEPDSVDEFMSARLPDRVLTELREWTQEVYGQRPTTPSTGS